MVCKQCGASIPDNAKFCINCGAKKPVPVPVPAAGQAAPPAGSAGGRTPQARPARPAAGAGSDTAQVQNEICRFWPDWEIVSRIGEGSFGVVYKAKRDELGTSFYSAIKVIRIPHNSSEANSIRSEIGLDARSTTAYFKGLVDDCVNEIKLMESLKGTANIVSVEDYKVVPNEDESAWTIYIRMELLKSFAAYAMNRTLTEKEVVKLGVDICSALECCAKRSVMHRDIKPENIFVSDFGDFKLGDFGIARKLEKSTMGMSKKGTYNYMAPEIYNGSTDYDARSDLYSLGIVLYKLLNNNRFPLVDPNSAQVTYQAVQAAFDQRMRGAPLSKPVNAGGGLGKVILRACAFDPAQRFESATAMKAALLDPNGKAAAAPAAPAAMNVTVASPSRAGTGRQPAGQGQRPVAQPQQPAAPRQGQYPSAPVQTPPGQQAQTGKKQKPEKKKTPKWKKILITVGVVLLVLAIGAGVLAYKWYTSAEQQLLRAIEAGDYAKAMDILAVDGEVGKSDELISNLSDRIKVVKDGFSNSEIEYEVAKMELSTIQKMKLEELEDGINDALAFIDRVNESRTHFNTAESFLAAGRYVEAMDQYQQVIEDDVNYETAKSQLAVAVSSYRESILTTAAGYVEAGEYSDAIYLLQSALNILENDAELTKQLELCQNGYITKTKEDTLTAAAEFAQEEDYINAMKTLSVLMADSANDTELTAAYNKYFDLYVKQVIDAAKAKLDEKDYAAAISILKAGLKNAPDNAKLTEQLDKATTQEHDSYVSGVIAQAEEKVGEGDYDGAIALINSGLKKYPNDQKLTEKLNAINAAKPVPISSLKAINSGGWDNWNSGSPTDPFGNDYSNASNYVIIDSWYGTDYIEYRIYGKYEKLTGTLAPYTSLAERSSGYLQVYVDDELRYTSKDVGRKTDAFPFEVDVRGADYVKIVATANNCQLYMILSNVMLWPAQE